MNSAIGESFETVLMKHEGRIYYHIHKLNIVDPHREFYQEGLCALWEAYHTFQPEKSQLSTHLHNTIHNRLIDLLRKKACQQRYDKMYYHEEMKRRESGNRRCNVNMLIHDDLVMAIHEAELSQQVQALLTVNQWKWVKFHILLGLSNHEIAGQEGVSIAAVHSWAKTAKQKLRKKWVDWNRYVDGEG
ncbi:sigma-70 family RNA polymerase sigma factor [Lentibacillus sp. N15]|uniref:sigma-70 family RNA polymerase sigma factor n=1 Tax=Lentibacillus songyuanensis TaxID=3136161 RepID=UPI0031BAED22